MKNLRQLIFSAVIGLSLVMTTTSSAQVVAVGSGSYTKTFPGTDAAARNSYPSGTPQLSGNAIGKPVPTNDWWSKLVKEDHVSNLFSYPFTMRTMNDGMVVSYIPWGVIGDLIPVKVGVTGLSASKATISDYSDWTVSMNWTDGTRNFTTTSGIAMPFLYFTKGATDVAQITVTSGTVTVSNEMLIITNAINGADFAVYAPVGSTWIQNGGTYTSTLNGKNYWSLAFIPLTAANVTTVANEYKKYAYVFPSNTTSSWNYNESTSVLRTDFIVTTDVKEGTESNMLMGLLPHQWANLAADSPVPDKYSYASIRGEIKTMAGNSFSVENTFYGILPTLPYVNNYSEGFTPTALTEKIENIQNDGLALWTDSYNEGQVMNRLIQTARIADEMGNTAARDKMLATIKNRLENWLTASPGEVAFIFYYNTTWSAMIGYPAGHGQDSNLNDHHFHWGYFIHAAAFLEQFEPGWAAQWGDMVNLLVRDAAGTDREDPLFPYLRNYSPYAGHCWANGFASFPQGNDQESTSESMQFNSSLIHWGTITGNDEIRDLGIYLYTTEQTAIEEYWFDMYERNFAPNHPYSLVSRVWGNSYDNGTFWTSDIAASYGIELYPIHGGSLYLGHNTDYVTKLWNEIKTNTGIMSNEANVNLWHDVMWKYMAFIDPAGAIALYNSYPDRSLKFGISDAQTYHWLHAMNALGRVDATITANYPIAAAFNLNGDITYVAHNYSDAPITVLFSTGYELNVPAGKMKTSKDIDISGILTSSFSKAYPNGSVELTLTAKVGSPTKVEFVNGTTSLGTVTSAPFVWNATQLTPGKHNFYAKVFDGEKFNTSNNVQVLVGNQLPYGGTAWPIPGIIEAGKFDVFEGGNGQNVAYLDLSPDNAGDFRKDEYVDASTSTTEGAVVGWISGGEWLEYTVNVTQSGLYSFAFRYASGNASGGGPFSLELDGKSISGAITVPSTSTTNWNVWATKTVTNIPLTPGTHVLRVLFASGEFNLGRMTFTRTGNLNFSYPTANAGVNQKVVLPANTAQLDGSASTESTGQALTYSWTQNYGPSVAEFTETTAINPTISNLIEGIYSFKLTVTNADLRTASDEVFVIVSSTDNISPTVALMAPANNSSYSEGTQITITASASDFDGAIQKVDFYQNGVFIASDNTHPYSILWSASKGNYALTAIATDNQDAESTSQIINVTMLAVQYCAGTSTGAIDGSFTLGYNFSFTTVGTNVTITFELLDNKSGVVAYLWNKTPFSEKSMTNIGGKKFSTTVSGLAMNETIEVACKFAFAGGMAVTKYLTYKFGEDCGHTSVETSTIANVTFYPNPVNDVLQVHSDSEIEEVIVRNISGQIVKRILANSDKVAVNLSDTSTGIYFITVKQADGNSSIHKAVKL